VLPSGLDPAPLLKEVTARFREELDYRQEARQSEAFRAFWAHEPQVVVPAVVPSHSSGRVLTSEWVSGMTLEEAALRSEAERRAYATQLWTFVFRSLLVGGAFNADPHPGNYFFQENGRIAFLDFGCVQLMPEPARKAALVAHQAAVMGDHAGFHTGMAALMQSKPGVFEDTMVGYVRSCFKPIFDSPFRITREWVGETTRAGQDTKQAVLARGSNVTLPPAYLAMMNRLQFGFYSVVARLDVEVDYRRLHAQIVDEARAVPVAPIADALR
jgi:predicted unusual protein kinase regulating ubiquinone biosynthesis (AarF/ABC1/UbiB family)